MKENDRRATREELRAIVLWESKDRPNQQANFHVAARQTPGWCSRYEWEDVLRRHKHKSSLAALYTGLVDVGRYG